MTPRVIIVRHGETEWSLSGRHTGTTDIPLTADGERRVRATGKALVGEDRLIVPEKLAHIRAQRTFELLNLRVDEPLPWKPHGPTEGAEDAPLCPHARLEVTESIREWDYGDYEGLTTPEIRERRAAQGITAKYDIWKDGCPGGESVEEVTSRLDAFIREIREKWHAPALASGEHAPDVLVVAHGHILRAFAQRWIGRALDEGPALIMEAGGVGSLSYEHNSIHEPAILLGGAFSIGHV